MKDCQNQTHMSRESARLRFEVSTHSTATRYSSNEKPTAEQLVQVQVRREHAIDGNSVLFQSKTNFLQEKNYLLGNYTARLQKDCCLVFPRRKSWFSVPKAKFLATRWFWAKQPTISQEKMLFFRWKTKQKYLLGNCTDRRMFFWCFSRKLLEFFFR